METFVPSLNKDIPDPPVKTREFGNLGSELRRTYSVPVGAPTPLLDISTVLLIPTPVL